MSNHPPELKYQVFPNASLTSCPDLDPNFSQTQVSEDKFALKFQFSPEVPAKPSGDYCITSTSEGAETPCLAAGGTQDITQKPEAAHPQGRGKGSCFPEKASGHSWNNWGFFDYLVTEQLGHNVISWRCWIQTYRNFTVSHSRICMESVLVK